MASNIIFERIANSFNSDESAPNQFERPKTLSRYMGGHGRNNHPYISGYWQFFLNAPSGIFETDDIASGLEWWHSAAEGFTPPTRTLNKADVPGQGGVNSSWVTGQTLTRTFTVTFREYRDLPINHLIEQWVSVIDPYVGVSPIEGAEWLGKTYKGSAFAILTKPTGAFLSDLTMDDIEEIFYFHGVWPENHPTDTFASDIAANDVAQHNITFSFDGWPLTRTEPDVREEALKLLQGRQYLDSTYDVYLSDLKGGDS